MTPEQARLLVVTEWKFYSLQLGEEKLYSILKLAGVPRPDVVGFTLEAYISANTVIRKYLRTQPT